jgi:hypothetical protein
MLKKVSTLLCLLLVSSFQKPIQSSQEETALRSYLFNNYDKNSRPIQNINDPLNVEMGLAIQTLEQFNQKTETIKLNIWFRMNWMNDYMNWENQSNFTINSIDVNSANIWTPDIELLNAASLPEIYTLKGGLMLYNTGECMWSRPVIFLFSCPLKLHDFPFDTQRCSMTFSSWIFTNEYLRLTPYSNKDKAVDILNDFSHSEWNVKSIEYKPFNITTKSHQNKSAITYTIELERFTHYYTLTMGMTITLVYVSFLIMFLPPDNISRTSTAVFIPLTILALQLTIIDKVPVVGYYTLMDKFFLSCFISSMMVSMLSAIIFALISHKSHKVLELLSKFKNIDELKKGSENVEDNDNNDEIYEDKTQNNEEDLLEETQINKQNKKIINIEMDDITIGKEYNNPIGKRTISYKSAMTQISNDKPTSKIIKTINYDNKLLDLSDDELLLYSYMTSKIKLIDNLLRILLPFVFTIYIAVLLD